LGFILGYVTGVNFSVAGKGDFYAGMDVVDIAGWVASWCRDNPTQALVAAVVALTKSRGVD